MEEFRCYEKTAPRRLRGDGALYKAFYFEATRPDQMRQAAS
jgi:hypothetical protein